MDVSDEMGTFTTAEAARLTGLTVRQLDYWAQQGIFVPSACQARGSGTHKRYSHEDLIQLHALRRVKTARWSTQNIHEAVSLLRQVMDDPHPLRQALLIADRKTLFAIFKTEQGRRVVLETHHPGGQQFLPLVLETVAEETRRAIDALNK